MNQKSLSREGTRHTQAPEAKAEVKAIDSPGNIAMMDAGVDLIAHVRMDGARIASTSHSINKTLTSLPCRGRTQSLGENAQPGGQFYGISDTVDGRLTSFAGGIPREVGEEYVGAVGIRGGKGRQDQAIAETAAAAL